MEGVNSTFNIDAFYETLIDQTPLGIAVQTPDGKVARANSAFCEMFGYDPGEVVGSQLDDLVAREEDLSADAGDLTELVLRGRSNLAERVRVRKDGSRFPVLIWGVPIIQGDRVLAVYAIYEDISERKVAERELARERSVLERIVVDSPDGMVLFDEEGTVFRSNPAFDRLFDLGQDEVLGHHLWEILGGGGKEEEIRGYIRQLRDRKRLDYDAVRFRKDGSEIHLSIRAVAITGDGPSGEYLAVYRDISSRVMVQQQLATERTYFENLFMNSPLAIALVGGDGIIQRVNDSFERLFGYYSYECVGADLDALIAPGELRGDAVGLTRGAADGTTIKAERTRRRKDGSWVEVQINAVCFPVGDGTTLIYAIYQDITERKMLDDKIRFFGCHDALTGLYNQSFFEEELRR
ncbi:MAG: PAS domain S-box protein, partial [Synergistaceae bacterium]|nr:PAS domain S-box protein [Synergistaceae bacterium]